MESSVEKLEGLAHKLTVEIPAEIIDQAVIKELKALRPKVKIDGFRPGKVPPEVIKQRYGQGVRQDVISKEINVALQNAMQKHEYNPAASPEINLLSTIEENQPLKFEAHFEIMPEVDVKGLDDLQVTLPQAEITDKDITEMLETLRRQQATFNETDSEAELNDRVTIDFIGSLDGVNFEGGSGNDVAVTIGAGQMLPDFENGLKGIKVNEEKTFDVAFPEQYQAEDLKGKTAQFTATAKKVEKCVLPELDDAFIAKFGNEAKNLDEFKAAIKKNMERELKLALSRIRRDRLFNAILEKNQDQLIPNSSVHQEMERMAAQMNLAEQIKNKEQLHQLMHQLFEPQAKKQVSLGFLLGKLFEDYHLELDQKRVEEKLNDIASTYEDPAEVKKWYQKDRKAKISLESAVLEEQLIDKIYENTQVSYEDADFQAVMNINNSITN